jgi:hypothetical protein
LPRSQPDGVAGEQEFEKHQAGIHALEVSPWDTQIDGLALTAELKRVIREHLVIGDHQLIAAVLWIMLSYLFDFDQVIYAAPILHIHSPVKRCGKTTLIDILHFLAQRAIVADNISAAAVYRVVAELRPTLLVDEADWGLRRRRDLIDIWSNYSSASRSAVVGQSPQNRKLQSSKA